MKPLSHIFIIGYKYFFGSVPLDQIIFNLKILDFQGISRKRAKGLVWDFGMDKIQCYCCKNLPTTTEVMITK